MGEAGIGLQRAVLHEFDGAGTRGVVGDDLVAVTVHGQDRHADLLQVLAVVLADELRDTLVLPLAPPIMPWRHQFAMTGSDASTPGWSKL